MKKEANMSGWVSKSRSSKGSFMGTKGKGKKGKSGSAMKDVSFKTFSQPAPSSSNNIVRKVKK